jgi:PIN domain nuclease of toxin-antitoxin system
VVILDTCALLWRTMDPSSLSVAARQVIDQADSVGVSSISIWEIGVKVRKKKLELPFTVRAFVNRLRQTSAMKILPVDDGTWLDALDLAWEHSDPADRVIVACALRMGLPLVTNDEPIRRFYKRTIW